MAIPAYFWLKDDGGADVRGSVDVYGRRLFRIHGERREGPAGFASTGCIIMSNPTRRLIRGTSETLEVVR